MTARKILTNEKGGGSFLILITTLNMLLLAFFIVLNSIAVIDDSRKLKALSSLLGTLGLLSAGTSPGFGDEKRTFPRSVEIETLDEHLLDIVRRVEQFALEAQMEKDISLQFGKKGLMVYLTNRITFKKGTTEIKRPAWEILKKIARLSSRISGHLNITGHADAGSYKTGPYPDDWTLSIARAGKVARLLMDEGEIQGKRISISGYGSTKPLFVDEPPEKMIFNDRIEIILDRRRGI